MRVIPLCILLFTTAIVDGQHPAGVLPGKKLPGFRENKGQITDQYGHCRSDIQFQLALKGLSVFIGNGEIHYQFNKIENPAALIHKKDRAALLKNKPSATKVNSYRVDVALVGANTSATVITENSTGELDNYVVSGLPEKNALQVQSYQKITYKNVYPGIDWVLYIAPAAEGGSAESLKYDFIVHPGGKAENIKLRYAGATSLTKTPEGSLLVQTPLGNITEHTPYSYNAASRKTVSSRFELDGDVLGFVTGANEGTLVIDPVLDWGTYYGGEGAETGFGICTDNSGNVYMTGATVSTNNIATTGSYQSAWEGVDNGMLVKFNKAGVRQWATYFGGAANLVYGMAVACDKPGNVYMTGLFFSVDPSIRLATPGSHQPDAGGDLDAYVAKFDDAGMLQWATCYGGAGEERGFSITCDANNNVYMAGYTTSADNIASAGSFQTVYGGSTDAFLVKFTSAGVRAWSTYYGGTNNENAYAVACDRKGNVYFGGDAGSPDLGTAGTHQETMAGGGDALLVKFNALGQRQWATYYANGIISGIAVDSVSNMYVTGTTSSRTGFATPGAFQTDLFPVDYGGGPYYTYEAFLAKFSEAGRRVWGTYYGNSSGVNGNTVTCDKLGHVYIGGNTGNPPDATLSQMYTPNGYQTSWGGGYYYDGYVARFDTAGKREWASLWGGNGDDIITAIACDANNVVYMAGTTASTNNIATPGSHQPVYAGIPLDDFSMSQDAFVVKLNDCFVVANPTAINGNKTICPGTTQTYTVAPAIACASSYTWFLPSGWKGNSTGNSITVTAGETGGIIGVQANGPYDTSFKKIEIIAVYQTTPPVISLNGSALMAAGNNTAWQWYLNDQPITGATGKEYAASKNGSYKVITTDQNGCADTSAVYNLALKGNLFVPNMFSPNGDGNNDVLKVYGNLLEKVDFLVFNQWGQKIYESHDVNGVWDGRSSGHPQPVGVYVYTLKVTLTTGEVMQQKGTFSLVR